MSYGQLERCAGAQGTFEWTLPEFSKLSDKHVSEMFAVGLYPWRLMCYPKQGKAPWTHVSVFLECPNVSSGSEDERADIKFTLTVLNHKDPGKNLAMAASCIYDPGHMSWGFDQLLPLTDISVGSGYLRHDGALVIRTEMEINLRPRKRAREVGSDLRALLDDPGPTSDVTLLAGGRSFPAHRAILAARSEFFKTLFAAGFCDSTARELPLPDVDTDALDLLLAYIYSGTLDMCPRGLLKPAAELADRLLLSDAVSELELRIMNSTTLGDIVEDLLWAELHGSEQLIESLEKVYIRLHAKKVDESAIASLAERNPKLMARLYVMAMNDQK